MSQRSRVLTPQQRRQRNHDEVSANILQAAREVMREQGVADLNLQQIARRVGMRAPSLYNYFASRNAIYEALFVMGMQMYRERLGVLLDTYGVTWEGLERAMEGYLSFALENPELYQLLFERPVPGFVPSADGMAESRKLLELAQRMAEEAIVTGTFKTSLSADVTANLFISLMHGFTALHLANEPQIPAESGRFGSLIPVIMDLLKNAWANDKP